MVVWLIGLSASGKTSIGRELVQLLNHSDQTWALVDGDDIRNLMGQTLSHTVEDRKKNSDRIVQLCSYLDQQQINVVACVLSIFPEVQRENNKRFLNYKQIYISVNDETLRRRDNKQLYTRADNGELQNVVGVDIDFPEPVDNDVIIENNDDNVSPLQLAEQILRQLDITGLDLYGYTGKNLLTSKENYFYSKKVGPSFFDSYKENRNNYLQKLESNILNLAKSSWLGEIGDHQTPTAEFLCSHLTFLNEFQRKSFANLIGEELISKENSESDHISTRNFLLDRLVAIDNGNWNWTEDSDSIKWLIKRFEVSKRVYRLYRDEQFKKLNNDFSDYLNFLLFHLTLLRIYPQAPQPAKPILYNCMLKLGDIMVSAPGEAVTPSQQILTYCCLQQELGLLEREYGI